jgi:uncharacterized protein YjiS (DUF1127 family)
MATLTNAYPRSSLGAPRLSARRALGWLLERVVALDTLFRERSQLAEMDERMLRDVGVTRVDVEDALRRPAEHLGLILLRGGHQP